MSDAPRGPLVSIMVPCYNSAETLPMALASVLAQTYSTWECIIVDDGSSDDPHAVVSCIDDPRVRFHRFEKNRGRAAARQQALDMAQGEYVSMVDADDWLYPWKIERQVDIMERHPDVAVLSSGMAIVNMNGNIDRVRSQNPSNAGIHVHPLLSKPQSPPIAHGPAMLRLDVAKKYKYDERFRLAQDADFLLQLTMSHSFSVVPDVTYAYTELTSASLAKIIRAHNYTRQMFLKYRRGHWVTVYKLVALTYVKSIVYMLGFGFGLGTELVKRRSRPPTTDEIAEFARARAAVIEVGNRYFAGTRYESAFADAR